MAYMNTSEHAYMPTLQCVTKVESLGDVLPEHLPRAEISKTELGSQL